MKHRHGLTPGTQRFIAMRVTDEEDKLPTKEHATYQSGVGTLLYPTKHSRPDLCNAVRELSKTMDRPAPIHLKRNAQDHQICTRNERLWTQVSPKRMLMVYSSLQ